MADRVHHAPTRLSGGQMQRVPIAWALVTNPALLLAGEPTGNLEEASGAEVKELFDHLHAAGRTIVMISTTTPSLGWSTAACASPTAQLRMA